MARSRDSPREVSWSLIQGSDTSLGTVDTASFVQVLDRYESEAKSIQTTFRAIHNQLRKSASASGTPHRENSSLVTEQMIANLQERLKQLDVDRQELNEQMHRLANLSELSSFVCPEETPPKGRGSRSKPSRLSLSTLTDTGSPIEARVETLKAENARLRAQLSAQADVNRRLRIGLTSIVRFVSKRNDLVSSRLISPIEQQSDRLDAITQQVAALRIRSHTNTAILHHFLGEFASQKASIASILNSFQGEIFRARYACVDALARQQSRRGSESGESIFQSPVDPRRNLTYGGRRPGVAHDGKADNRAGLLAAGCDQLVRSIAGQLRIDESFKPAIELVRSPADFGRRITRICAITESSVQELREEIEALRKRLGQVQSTLSPEVADLVTRILGTIEGLSRQMHAEHEELIARLV
jgi:cob(I)alamin adenosyltransferase